MAYTTNTEGNTHSSTRNKFALSSSPESSDTHNNILASPSHQHSSEEASWNNIWSDEKMESLTQRTERSQEETINSASLLSQSKTQVDDEDDNTTIQSLESAQHEITYTSYSAAASTTTPFYGYTIAPAAPDASGVSSSTGLSHHHHMVVGTPSTTSTAPSSADDGSLGVGDSSALGISGPNNVYHRRVPSWEGLPPHPHHQLHASTSDQPPNAWGSRLNPQQQPYHQQQRVATFRELDGFPPMVPTSRWAASGVTQSAPQQRFSDPALPFLPSGQHPDHRAYHPRQPPASYSMRTPPRAARLGTRGGQQQTPNTVASSPHTANRSANTGGSRSSSEVLKTLLRKKACLYEPGTSRAVTLITWLVGRQLALANGFFSRQQLQAGVHSCVFSKIESGVITRTKVNRCMQIILNSCFHYIIPRPDGTEENGNMFCKQFAEQVSNDEHLLNFLPSPWNNMKVDREAVLKAALAELKSPSTTPQPSPQLTSLNAAADSSPGRETTDAAKGSGGDDGKRAVLLCFNENVRCAEDVFRCHNEFIRDTAHAANLQLGSLEWQSFFAKEASHDISPPFLIANAGIAVPQHEGNSSSSPIDALGVMTAKEAGVFRTSWCAKRYEHNHELCGFAHAEINDGWLRRDPSVYSYKDEVCPLVTRITLGRGEQDTFVLNECSHGVSCSFAHSMEEIAYHPRRYKARMCHSASTPGGCRMGDVCPHFHPLESYRFPKKSDTRSPRHSRSIQQTNSNKSGQPQQQGAVILYASPAPVSQFEAHMMTPGLRNLYRRHCSVARANLRSKKPPCIYNLFGDDTGIAGTERESVRGPNPIGPTEQPR